MVGSGAEQELNTTENLKEKLLSISIKTSMDKSVGVSAENG